MGRVRGPGTMDVCMDILTEIEIRTARERDAPALKRFGETLLSETAFFHRTAPERAASVDEMAAVIRSIRAAPCCEMINAWYRGEPVGEAILVSGQLDRIRHTATVGIGVLHAFNGQGIARALMQRLEHRALTGGVLRLELTVMTTNGRAIAFYQKQGYQEEGLGRSPRFRSMATLSTNW